MLEPWLTRLCEFSGLFTQIGLAHRHALAIRGDDQQLAACRAGFGLHFPQLVEGLEVLCAAPDNLFGLPFGQGIFAVAGIVIGSS